ncbi:S9 family peptidase [Cupriavidus gilardii]|nr:S9 family peptidase [Cupriavidus gilardii]
MTPHHSNSKKRHLTIDDVLKMDTFLGMHAPCFSFSPDGGRLAFCVQRSLQQATRHTDFFLGGVARSELWVVDLTSMHMERVTLDGDGFGPCWSPDGTALAFGVATAQSIRLSVLELKNRRRVTPLPIGNLELRGKRPFEWIDGARLACAIVRGEGKPRLLDIDRRACRSATAAWALLDRPPANTASVLDSPAADTSPMHADEGTGDYVVFDLRTGETVAALESGQQEALSVFIQRFNRQPSDPIDDRDADTPPEIAHGELVASHPASGKWLFLVEDVAGTALTLVDRTKDRPVELFRTNRHLAEIDAGAIRDVDFIDSEGKPNKVRVLLPPNHGEGRAYPAVVWVYPGATVGPQCRHLLKPHEAGPFCLQLLAAHGYVVIEPDLSLPSDLGSRNLAQWTALRVEQAVAAASTTGLVDVRQLHVMGHSLGGWAAMALLVETDLFRSGIAMAGVSNVASFHGTFDARFRYDDDNEATVSLAEMCERVFRIPGPPCKFLDRYNEISPVFGAHRIAAPLIIVQGDQDYVGIAQGEEMYSALRRLGKPVRFVRYWGEGHVISGAENIKDMWARLIDWLGETGRKDIGVQ